MTHFWAWFARETDNVETVYNPLVWVSVIGMTLVFAALMYPVVAFLFGR